MSNNHNSGSVWSNKARIDLLNDRIATLKAHIDDKDTIIAMLKERIDRKEKIKPKVIRKGNIIYLPSKKEGRS